jgi:hypothetical protein
MLTENLGSGHKQTESCSGEPATKDFISTDLRGTSSR